MRGHCALWGWAVAVGAVRVWPSLLLWGQGLGAGMEPLVTVLQKWVAEALGGQKHPWRPRVPRVGPRPGTASQQGSASGDPPVTGC